MGKEIRVNLIICYSTSGMMIGNRKRLIMEQLFTAA